MKNYKIIFLLLILPTLIFGSENLKILIETPTKVSINETFIVNVELHKSDIQGFAKFEVIFPCNIIVESINNSTALFVAKDNNVKFIWLDIPKDEIINLSFTINIPFYNTDNINIKNNFYYLSDNERKVLSEHYIIKLSDKLISNSNYEASVNKLEANKEDIKRRILFDLNTNLNREIVYRVQIIALKNNVSDEFLKEIIENEFDVKTETKDGYIKYYIGNFYSLDIATMFKDYCGIRGAFIIPTYKGERITIKYAKEIRSNSMANQN